MCIFDVRRFEDPTKLIHLCPDMMWSYSIIYLKAFEELFDLKHLPNILILQIVRRSIRTNARCLLVD